MPRGKKFLIIYDDPRERTEVYNNFKHLFLPETNIPNPDIVGSEYMKFVYSESRKIYTATCELDYSSYIFTDKVQVLDITKDGYDGFYIGGGQFNNIMLNLLSINSVLDFINTVNGIAQKYQKQ